jgi:solute carrier family 10 (sodium/bile acid cotransporter), member 7
MPKLLKLLSSVGLSVFFLLLLSMIGLAALDPSLGARGSLIPFHFVADYGVCLIFFFYGLKLSVGDIADGLKNWRLHLLVQAATFVLFPLVVLAVWAIARAFGLGGGALWLGVLYVAALPSTVSSSVVMVSIAGGNIAAAVLNASLSSLIGIFITPLWMSLFLSQSGAHLELGPVILKLCLEVLLPVVLGLVFHRWWGAWADRHKRLLKVSDQSVILLIVYTAFCDSFASHQFEGHSALEIALLGAAMLSLFLCAFALMAAAGKALGFDRKDRIVLLFCGSKKSLVQGAAMCPVMFPGMASGLVLLPLMLYHALQLMAGSVIAERMSRRAGDMA